MAIGTEVEEEVQNSGTTKHLHNILLHSHRHQWLLQQHSHPHQWRHLWLNHLLLQCRQGHNHKRASNQHHRVANTHLKLHNTMASKISEVSTRVIVAAEVEVATEVAEVDMEPRT